MANGTKRKIVKAVARTVVSVATSEATNRVVKIAVSRVCEKPTVYYAGKIALYTGAIILKKVKK